MESSHNPLQVKPCFKIISTRSKFDLVQHLLAFTDSNKEDPVQIKTLILNSWKKMAAKHVCSISLGNLAESASECVVMLAKP